MDVELWFSIAGVLSMIGWVLLLATPLSPKWTQWGAGVLIPVLLSGGYVFLALFFSNDAGGFGTLAEVAVLFSHKGSLLAGWVHFLAFDLMVGAWMCRTAQREGIRFWMVVPWLPLTFLFGPAGFLAFSAVRLLFGSKETADLAIS